MSAVRGAVCCIAGATNEQLAAKASLAAVHSVSQLVAVLGAETSASESGSGVSGVPVTGIMSKPSFLMTRWRRLNILARGGQL